SAGGASCADGEKDLDPTYLGTRLSYVEHGAGTTFYSYAPLGEVIAVYELPSGSTNYCDLRITRYTYDGLGRLTAVTYPSNRNVAYIYGATSIYPTSLTLTQADGSSETLASSIEMDV